MMKLEHNDVDFWSALYFFPEIVKGGVTVARTDLVLYPGTLIFVSRDQGHYICIIFVSYLDPGTFIFVSYLYPGTHIFVSYLYPGTFIFVSYLLSYLDPGIFIFVFIFVFKFCNHNLFFFRIYEIY